MEEFDDAEEEGSEEPDALEREQREHVNRGNRSDTVLGGILGNEVCEEEKKNEKEEEEKQKKEEILLLRQTTAAGALVLGEPEKIDALVRKDAPQIHKEKEAARAIQEEDPQNHIIMLRREPPGARPTILIDFI